MKKDMNDMKSLIGEIMKGAETILHGKKEMLT